MYYFENKYNCNCKYTEKCNGYNFNVFAPNPVFKVFKNVGKQQSTLQNISTLLQTIIIILLPFIFVLSDTSCYLNCVSVITIEARKTRGHLSSKIFKLFCFAKACCISSCSGQLKFFSQFLLLFVTSCHYYNYNNTIQ